MNVRISKKRLPFARTGWNRLIAAGVLLTGALAVLPMVVSGWNLVVWEIIAATFAVMTLSPDGNWRKGLGFRRFPGMTRPEFLRWLLVLLGGTELLTALWWGVLKFFAIPFAEQQEWFDLFLCCSPAQFALLTVMVTAVAPVVEELLFRRVLFALLLPLGVWTAAGLTAAIFAAVHFYLLGAPGLLFIGLVLQLVFLKSRSLGWAVALHAANNALNVAMIGLVRYLL